MLLDAYKVHSKRLQENGFFSHSVHVDLHLGTSFELTFLHLLQ